MKQRIPTYLGFAFLLCSFSSVLAVTQYVINDEHTSLGFEVDHLMISKVQGIFKKFDGELTVNDQKSALLSISGYAEAASVSTNHEKRDKHLRSKEFFDSKRYPRLEFKAENLDIEKGDSETVDGLLTIRGVTKEVPVKITFKGIVKDPWGTEAIVVDAESEIDRRDFGLTWNEALETGGIMVGERVKITVRAEGHLKIQKSGKK